MSAAYYVIYKNILEYIRGRKYTITNTNIDKKHFLKQFESDAYVEIEATNKEKESLSVLIMHPEGHLKGLDSKLKNFLKSICSNYDETVVVTTVNYENPQNITKISNITSVITEECDTKIIFRSYDNFLYNALTTSQISPHHIVDKNEVKKILSDIHLSLSEIPKIYDHDTAITWIGGVAGDVVEVERISPTAIVTKVYRLVITAVK